MEWGRRYKWGRLFENINRLSPSGPVLKSGKSKIEATADPTNDPTANPPMIRLLSPSNDPTPDPTHEPTADPTADTTADPTKIRQQILPMI